MGHIENLSCPEEAAQHAPDVYKVTTDDLTAVTRALDRMRDLVMIRAPCQLSWEVTKLAKSKHDVPLQPECKRAIQAILLHEHRLRAQRDLVADSQDETQSGSGPLT